MNAPQVILIAISSFGMAIAITQHGKPQLAKHNVGTSIIANAVLYGLLIWGGFFK